MEMTPEAFTKRIQELENGRGVTEEDLDNIMHEFVKQLKLDAKRWDKQHAENAAIIRRMDEKTNGIL